MKNLDLLLRIIFDILLIIVAIFMPWWISLTIAAISALVFPNFLEIMIVGLWIDAVQFNGNFNSIPFFFTMISGLFYLMTKSIRKIIRFSY